MQDTATASLAPVEGARPPHFAHIYSGKFKDLKPDIRAVILKEKN